VYGDDALVNLADAAEVLPLYARGFVPLLDGTGLVDEPDGAEAVVGQGGQQGGRMALEFVAGARAVPVVILEELLQGPDGGAGAQGDGFDGLAWEIGKESADIGVQVGEGSVVGTAGQQRGQVVDEGRPQSSQLLLRHEGPPRQVGGFLA
jgi:hypothetical protein